MLPVMHMCAYLKIMSFYVSSELLKDGGET